MANSNGYPFITQKEIVARLTDSITFQVECLQILVGRQTDDEVAEKVTKHTNKRGLRCSEAVWMVALDAKVRNTPGEVTQEEVDRLARTLPKYRKQLAAHFRQVALNEKPELAEQAKVFGL